MIYFSSDQHFYHKNVITYCNRPYASLEEMHQALIDNWNKVVQPTDTIFILGDFCFGGVDKWKGILSQLQGEKHLVKGNHDMKQAKPERAEEFGFKWIGKDAVIKDDELGDILLSHYPYHGDHTEGDRYLDRRPTDKGGWLLHGHVHCAWKMLGRQINIGVDQWNFTPVSLEEVREYIKRNKNL